jgi:small subunit ribosomal protein S3
VGQKVHPVGFRLGINRTWNSRWFAGSEFASFVIEDNEIRRFLRKRLSQAGISKIEIDRATDKVRLRIYTSRPGIIIGKRGVEKGRKWRPNWLQRI